MFGKKNLTPVWIGLVALAFRLFNLGSKSLWDDEAATLAMATMPVAELLPFMRGYDTHGPIYTLLPKVFGVDFASSEFQFRLVYALTGTAAVVFGYLLFSSLWGKRAAVFGAVFMALSPLYIQASQEGRLYPILLLFFAITTWMVAVRAQGKIAISVFCAVYIFFSICGLHTDLIPFAGCFLFHWLLVYSLRVTRREFCFLVVSQAISVILCLPYAMYFFRGDGNMGYSSHLSGQASRIFASPIDQTMMFVVTAFRSFHYLFASIPTYFRFLPGTLSTQSSLGGWALLLIGSVLWGYGIARMISEKTPVASQRILRGLGLGVAIGVLGIALLHGRLDKPMVDSFLFFLPLFFLGTLLVVSLVGESDYKVRQRDAILFFVGVPLLFGAKMLVPMDPRHFGLSFVVVVGLMGKSVSLLFRHKMGRAIVVVLFAWIAVNLFVYFRESVEIYHPQGFKEAAAYIASDLDSRDVIYVDLGWGGFQAVTYYLDKAGFPRDRLVWQNERQETNREVEILVRVEKAAARKETIRVLALKRLDSEFQNFYRAIGSRCNIEVRTFGEELLLLTLVPRSVERP